MPATLTAAAAYLASKRVVATTLTTAEIEEHVPRALRENAAFSAQTIYAEHISETYRDITTALDGRALNPTEIRTRMKLRLQRLGYEPADADAGTLKDLSSDLRTNLIINQNLSNARGYAAWRSTQNDTLLTVWPAQEMYRAMTRSKPREWRIRWNDARRSLGEGNTSATYAESDHGPFKALKNDPVWSAISRFGNPWPPFDFNSGMRLRQLRAAQAREDKILTADNAPRPQRDPMSQLQSSSAAGVPASILQEWIKPFAERARLHAGRVFVAPPSANLAAVIDAAQAGAAAQADFGFASQPMIAAAGLPPITTMAINANDVPELLAASSRAALEAAADKVKDAAITASGSVITATAADGSIYSFQKLPGPNTTLQLKSIKVQP